MLHGAGVDMSSTGGGGSGGGGCGCGSDETEMRPRSDSMPDHPSSARRKPILKKDALSHEETEGLLAGSPSGPSGSAAVRLPQSARSPSFGAAPNGAASAGSRPVNVPPFSSSISNPFISSTTGSLIGSLRAIGPLVAPVSTFDSDIDDDENDDFDDANSFDDGQTWTSATTGNNRTATATNSRNGRHEGAAEHSASVTTPLLSIAAMSMTSSSDSSCRQSNTSDGVPSAMAVSEQSRLPPVTSSKWPLSTTSPPWSQVGTSISASTTSPLLDVNFAFFPAFDNPIIERVGSHRLQQQEPPKHERPRSRATDNRNRSSSTTNSGEKCRRAADTQSGLTSPTEGASTVAPSLADCQQPTRVVNMLTANRPPSTDVNLNDSASTCFGPVVTGVNMPAVARLAPFDGHSTTTIPNSGTVASPAAMPFRQQHADVTLQNDRQNVPRQPQERNRTGTGSETDNFSNHLHHLGSNQQPQQYNLPQRQRLNAQNATTTSTTVNNTSLLSTLEFIDEFVE
jgi:hypothetical protein